jgi:3-deoxy-manno-octulosonate cytidylyltransferase (CMP-KDO synthetase)
MNYIGIIPARYHSTRFPGKPLCLIGGKTMIQRVYEQASRVNVFSDLIVATDDNRILTTVLDFGGKAVMTSDIHKSGTERCAEVYRNLINAYPVDDTVIVNIQGDEPFLQAQQIEELIACFDDNSIRIATLIQKIDDEESLINPNVVKVIVSTSMNAIYFSRYPIPYQQKKVSGQHVFFKHIGMYAFKGDTLLSVVALEPSSLELTENLEQLRWIENDIPIKTYITRFQSSISIDTPDDLKKANLQY